MIMAFLFTLKTIKMMVFKKSYLLRTYIYRRERKAIKLEKRGKVIPNEFIEKDIADWNRYCTMTIKNKQ